MPGVLLVAWLRQLPLLQGLQPQLRSRLLVVVVLMGLLGPLLAEPREPRLRCRLELRDLLVLLLPLPQELWELLVLLVLLVAELRDPQLRCRLELLRAPRGPQLRGRQVAARPVAKQTAASESEAALLSRTAK